MKLWQKNQTENISDIQKKIELFTIGSDKEWDIYLAKYDIQGSIAHAIMLESIGLLTKKELSTLLEGLNEIELTIENGAFIIENGVEDVHSQIELLLTRNNKFNLFEMYDIFTNNI